MSWGQGNWGELDKALREEMDEASYKLRRQHRKSAYTEIVLLTLAATAIMVLVAAIIKGMLP